jgi:hypothetical protein
MIRRFAALCVIAACVDEPTVATRHQDLDGAPADNAHEYSVGLCETEGGAACSTEAANCTGSLVAPNLVITARHCVDHGRQLDPVFCNQTFLNIIHPADMSITTHPDPYGGASPTWYKVAKVITPTASEFCATDLALIILDKNIPAAEATPAALDITRKITADKVAIAGRGALDVKLTEMTGQYVVDVVDTGNYRKRIAENIAVVCQPDEMCTFKDISDESGSFTAHANHLAVGPGAFPGDSGSGIVAQATISQPTPVVLAVTSLGTWAGVDQPNSTLGVHVSKHAALIATAAQEAATAGGYPLPDWVNGKLPDNSGSGSGSGSGSNDSDDDDGGCSTTPNPSLLLVLLLLTVRPSRRRASAACCAAVAR